MKQTTKTKVLVAGIVLVCCVILGELAVSAARVNQKYPKAAQIDVPQGETLMLEHVEVSASMGQTVFLDDFFSNPSSADLDVKLFSATCPLEEQQMFTYQITLHNTSEEAQKFPLYSFVLSSSIWANGIDMELFRALNTEASLSPTIPAGGDVVLELPFIMCRPQFNEQNWEKAPQQTYWLTYSAYPEYVRFMV